MSPKKSGGAEDPLRTLVMPPSERDHHLHPIASKFSLVEYADFECPNCAEGFHIIRELLRDLGDDLCFVYRSFPQPDIHPNAQLAAEAAEAADMQGKFWLMHDRLFEHQAELSAPLIHQLAKDMSLDMHRFELDLSSGEPRRLVEATRADGLDAGVEETPTFFVNGRMHVGSHEYQPLADALTAGTKSDS
jgi:protein-disulfide isomerase